MKSYDEITKSVLGKRDEQSEKIKKRNKMIIRIGVPTVSVCLAVIVGIGMWKSGELNKHQCVKDAIHAGIDDVVDPDETVTDVNDPVPGGANGDVSGDKGNEENNKVPEIADGTEAIAPSTEDAGGKVECPEGGDEIWIEPQWAEKALYSKYPEFELGGTTYYTAARWIEKAYLGEKLGSSVAKGYDIYTDASYEMGITVHEIKGISTAAAVAVSYNGFEGQYAVYTDNWYYPETLGEFIEALNLKENLTFGTIYHTFWEYESYMTVEYKIADPAVIWDMLLSDGSLVNVTDSVTDEEMSFYKESMSMSVSVELLGVKNVSFSVSENGYISTNILGTRKLFYIGEKKAQEFFDYVEKNFDGVQQELAETTAVTAPADAGYSEPGYPGDIATAVTEISPPYIPGQADPQSPSESATDAYQPEIWINE